MREIELLVLLFVVADIAASLCIQYMDAQIFETQSCLFPMEHVIGAGAPRNRTDAQFAEWEAQGWERNT